MNVLDVRIKQYQTALDHTQRYLTIALVSGVAFWLLRSYGTSERVYVAPFGVPVDPATARILLFSVHLVTAALANYSLESAKRLAVGLKDNADLAEVLRDYPSVAASPWPGVRLAVPAISLILLLWTLLSSAAAFSLTSATLWLTILVLSVHFPLILLLWSPSIGPWSLYGPPAAPAKNPAAE